MPSFSNRSSVNRCFPCQRSTIGLNAEYSLSRITRFGLSNLVLSCGRTSQKIIRKGLAFLGNESVSVVTVGTAPAQTGDPTHAHLHHWQRRNYPLPRATGGSE